MIALFYFLPVLQAPESLDITAFLIRTNHMKEKMFAAYPDVVNVDQLREMLGGIGYKAAYGLLHDGSIRFFKIGKAFRIPKINIIEYLQRNSEI